MQLDLYCVKCRFVDNSLHNRISELFIGDLSRRGYAAYSRKKYDAAASAFNTIIKLQPDNVEAVEFLKKVEAEQYSLEHLLAEARLAFQNRQYGEASEKSSHVCRLHPGHPEAEEILKQSRKELEKVAALETLAAEHIGQGDLATAAGTLEEILQRLPESEKHLTQLSELKERLNSRDRELRKAKKMIAAGNPEAAFTILEQLSTESPSDTEIRKLMNRASMKQDRVFELLPEAREAVEAEEYDRAKKLLARVLAVDKNHTEARELWRRADTEKRLTVRKWSLIGAGIVAGVIIFVLILVGYSKRTSNRFLLKNAREAAANGEYQDALKLYGQIGSAGVDVDKIKKEMLEVEVKAIMERAEECLANEDWSGADQALSEAGRKGGPADRIKSFGTLSRALKAKFTAKSALDEGRWLEALEIHEKILITPAEEQKVAGWKELSEFINSERLRARDKWLAEIRKNLDEKKPNEVARAINRGNRFFPRDGEAQTLTDRCLIMLEENINRLVKEAENSESTARQRKWYTAEQEAEKVKGLFPGSNKAASIAQCVVFDRQMAELKEQIAAGVWEDVETTLAILETSNPPKERREILEKVKNEVKDKIEAIRRRRFETLCKEGDEAFNGRDWKTAIAKYTKALEEASEDPRIERRLAQAKGQANAPGGMLYIPRGKFIMGSSSGGFKNEYPAHDVKLPAFYIGLTEVTNKEYREFVEATGHTSPPYWKDPNFNQPDQPVVGVNLEDARAYAKWKNNSRLPTEAEWEYASRGSDALTYPWGNEFDAERCRSYDSGEKSPKAVGSYPNGKSPWGCLDMAGNVFEWTSTKFGMYPGAPVIDDRAGKDIYIVKGGSYSSDPQTLRAAYRDRAYGPKEKRKSLGFRLAKDVKLSEEK
ncbi:MAG: SUMF1/EgtB/PvdO family nonheme iron enzyme [Planctomycetota bacterium]